MSTLDIAIIGMAGRFPGARDLGQFWRNLREGVESIRPLSDEALAAAGVDAALRAHPRYVRASPVLEDVEHFDAGFFGFSPREAERMDPQQRLLLECVWEALEGAGIDPRRFDGAIGLYAGTSISTYLLGNLSAERSLTLSAENLRTLLGNDKDYLATQVAYKLDLRGPVLSVQTACSTSLVAVHLACQALLDGECELALAGGVTVRLPHHAGYLYEEGGLFAPDGHCRPFDAQAEGTLFGSGSGVVVLKKLDQALADGDRIHALIKGSAINNDGARKAGFTAPGIEGQVEVLTAALGVAQVPPETIGYIEAHGTGTPLGDPIEVEALTEVYGAATKARRVCALGAVKSNVGHLEAAAGIAGLIKTVLALEHRELPPSLNFQTPNPRIDFEHGPFFVHTQLTEWKRGSAPRRAGVSSFGIGGTNAHVVLEEAPEHKPEARAETGLARVLPLSARSPEALRALAARYLPLLKGPQAPGLEALGYSASVRRAHHEHRLAVVGDRREAWAEKLEAWLEGQERPGLASGRVDEARGGKRVFVFPGQGSQWEGMGRQLMQSEPVFRQALETCEVALKRHVTWSLMEVLGQERKLEKVEVIQPVLFALQVALAALWKSWGVEPQAVVGHSMGEVAAAHVCGALSLEDAARIICERSRLVASTCGQGAMAVVELGAAEAQKRVEGKGGRVSVAASNGPRSTVVAGDKEAVGEVLRELEAEGRFCRWVKVDYASHSSQMEPLKPELMRLLGGVKPRAGTVPLYSTVTAQAESGEKCDAAYWVRNLRERVRFEEVVGRLKQEGYGVFVEMSPHPLLVNEVEASAAGGVVALGSLRRGEPERTMMLSTLGALYAAGQEIDWTKQYPHGGTLVSLPTYPWQRQRYWFEGLGKTRIHSRHPLLGESLHASVGPGTHFWQSEFSLEQVPFLADHRVQGAALLPASAYLEMVTSAAMEDLGASSPRLEDVRFTQALFLPEEGTCRLQLALTPEPGGLLSFQISSASADGRSWTSHASGTLRLEAVDAKDDVSLEEAAVRAPCPEQLSAARHYEASRGRGLEYGPAFQGVEELWRGEGAALGRIQLPSSVPPATSAYRIHPALLDACFQVVSAAVSQEDAGADEAYLPVGLESFRLLSPPRGMLWSHATLRPAADGDGLVGDVLIHDAEGRRVAQALGLRARRLEATKPGDSLEEWLYEVRWMPLARPSRSERPASMKRSGWLVFTDGAGVGASLVERLQARGERVVRVSADLRVEGLVRDASERYRLNPSRPEPFRQVLTETFGAKPPVGVLHLWSLDVAAPSDEATTWLREAEALGPVAVLHLAQALATPGWSEAPRVWIVTRGAQPVGAHPVLPGSSAVWGMVRTLAHEHPEWLCTGVDLDSARGEAASEAASLLEELNAEGTEDQIALRGEERSVARLVRAPRAPAGETMRIAAAGRPYRLEISQPGVLENLTLREHPRRAPEKGEVELEVRAAGLNFLDVLSALGMRPDVEPEGEVKPGGECSGVVVAVGEGVTGLHPGDEVIALAPFSFGTHVTTPAHFVVPKPPHLSFEQAAGLPIAFMTAHHALHHVGRLERGERVLIHSASGGTGLAAVQLAQRAGAEIFATAGSEEKRAWLRARGLPHVMDSRTLTFANEIRALTGGVGVDVVLNSLTGEALTQSLAVLAPYGRFLEIGKRDIYEDRRLGLAPFQRNLTYAAVDLARMMRERPERTGALLREVVALFADHSLQAPPTRAFPLSQAVEAFHLMAQARHLGKLVLCPEASLQVPIAPLTGAVRPEGTYLITGGLGGLGRVIARWLVERGARHLVLVGRGGVMSAEVREELVHLSNAGAQVVVALADVSDAEALTQLITGLERSEPPLRGVFHCAAVLDDGFTVQLDRERVRRVMAPKVDGAWHLHTLTRGLPLDFFVLFSSAASVLGSPGQSSYAAANAFLDALAWYRRALGLPAQSLNWGPWSEVGLAAAQANRGARLESEGLGSISPARGMEALARLMREDRVQVSVLPWELARWRRSQPGLAARPLVAELLADVVGTAGGRLDAVALLRTLRSASAPERPPLLESHLQDQVARTLRMDPSKLTLDRPLNSLGLDSLMAMELKKRVETSLGVSLPVVRFLKGPSITELARELLAHLATEDALQAVLAPAAAAPAADDAEWEVVRL